MCNIQLVIKICACKFSAEFELDFDCNKFVSWSSKTGLYQILPPILKLSNFQFLIKLFLQSKRVSVYKSIKSLQISNRSICIFLNWLLLVWSKYNAACSVRPEPWIQFSFNQPSRKPGDMLGCISSCTIFINILNIKNTLRTGWSRATVVYVTYLIWNKTFDYHKLCSYLRAEQFHLEISALSGTY